MARSNVQLLSCLHGTVWCELHHVNVITHHRGLIYPAIPINENLHAFNPVTKGISDPEISNQHPGGCHFLNRKSSRARRVSRSFYVKLTNVDVSCSIACGLPKQRYPVAHRYFNFRGRLKLDERYSGLLCTKHRGRAARCGEK